ncbi:hypothetical protein FQZ97_760350 [compost metagenome]
MQAAGIDFLQQVVAGDEGQGEEQQGDGDADGLAIGGKLVQQALPGGMRGSGRGFWSGRIGAHLAPIGSVGVSLRVALLCQMAPG